MHVQIYFSLINTMSGRKQRCADEHGEIGGLVKV